MEYWRRKHPNTSEENLIKQIKKNHSLKLGFLKLLITIDFKNYPAFLLNISLNCLLYSLKPLINARVKF